MQAYVALLSRGSFSIAVELSKDQTLTFESVEKANVVLRQVRDGMYGNIKDPKRRNYKVVVEKDGKFISIKRFFWVPKKDIDIVNGVGWRIVSKGKLDSKVRNKLLKFSNDIHDNSSNQLRLGSILKKLDEYLFGVMSASSR